MKAQDIIKKYELDQSMWTFKGLHAVLHTFFPVGEEPINPLRRHFGDAYGITLFFIRDNYMSWYWNDKDGKRLRDAFIERVNKSPKFLDEWLDLWHRLVGRLIEAYAKCEADLTKMSDAGLLGLYRELYNAYIEQYSVAIGIQDAFSMHAEEFFLPLVREALAARGREPETEKVFEMLTAPVTESFLGIEFKERMAILKEIKKDAQLAELFRKGANEAMAQLHGFPALRRALVRHAQKWFWIENNYAVQKVLGVQHFVEKLVHELRISTDPDSEIKTIEQRIPDTQKRKGERVKELGFGPDIKNLIRITEVFTYMQDERKKHVLICNHYQHLFAEEIGKRTGLSWQEMAYTIFPELEDILLRKEIDRKKLAERRRHCLCIHTADGYELFEGQLADEVYDTLFKPKETAAEIKGMCASQGKAQGVVKIVLKVHDLVNVTKGDILVTSMTRPEMVVAMEKAAAIVTDEGGITSHAAIVSRELGIPCIVGTKVATHVLKTGDLVEVDATKGTVKKVEHEHP